MKQGVTQKLMRGTLIVKEKVYLSPHYIRIVLTGPELVNFKEAKVGDNNKIILPNGVDGKINFPSAPLGSADPQQEPILIRTYTLRALDFENSEMHIDFVAHGDEGPASAWAQQATPGAQLGVMMKVKDRQLFEKAAWYGFVGDHTALPVMAVILETLPDDAVGEMLLEVHSPSDVLKLRKPEHMQLTWIFNNHPGEGSDLARHFEAVSWPATEEKFVFVAAEYQTVQDLQEYLAEKRALKRQQWVAHSYWRIGKA